MEGFAGSWCRPGGDGAGAVASGPDLTVACTVHAFEEPKESGGGEQGVGDGSEPPGDPSVGRAACLDPSMWADVSSSRGARGCDEPVAGRTRPFGEPSVRGPNAGAEAGACAAF